MATMVECEQCGGSGDEETYCGCCDGEGEIDDAECDSCEGTGVEYEVCDECGGSGEVEAEATTT